MLEKYNDGTRRKAMEKNIPLIDLAHLLPKSSEYFYDVVHMTNKGAEKTAMILYDSVRLLLHNWITRNKSWNFVSYLFITRLPQMRIYNKVVGWRKYIRHVHSGNIALQMREIRLLK